MGTEWRESFTEGPGIEHYKRFVSFDWHGAMKLRKTSLSDARSQGWGWWWGGEREEGCRGGGGGCHLNAVTH